MIRAYTIPAMLAISKEERNRRMRLDNPWWREPGGIEWKNHPRRAHFNRFYGLVSMTGLNRAIVLMGPRRVGKTVMSYQAIARMIDEGVNPANIFYAPLDHPLYAGMHLEQILNAFLELNRIPEGERVYIFFDEVQYLKDWEVHLKSLVDSYPQHRFIATGSSAAALKLKSIESGAGRFRDFTLPPLTFHEYLKFAGGGGGLLNTYPGTALNHEKAMESIEEINGHFINYINTGGYPESVLSGRDGRGPEESVRSDIVEKVLMRDLPSLYGISDIPGLNSLFTAIAYHTGQEISLAALAKGAKVAKATISKYIEYLEAAFLIRRVLRVDNNIRRFKRDHTFKVYLTNPSMYAALFGRVEEENSAVLGRLAETAVFSHLFHILQGFEAPYYARWKGGEVDLVDMGTAGIIKPRGAIEIKWSDRAFEAPSEIRGLLDFARRNGIEGEGNVMCLTKSKSGCKSFGGGVVTFVPVSLFCLEMGEVLNTDEFKQSITVLKEEAQALLTKTL